MVRLRTKMLATYLGVFAAALVPFAATAYFGANAALEAELGSRLIALANGYAAHLSITHDAGRVARLEPDSFATRERLQSDLRTFAAHTGVRRARIVDPALRSLVDTDSIAPGTTYYDLEPERTEIQPVIDAGATASSVLYDGPDGRRFKRGFAPIEHEGKVVAVLALEGDATYFSLIDKYRSLLLGYGFFATLLTVVVTVVVSRRITAPLQRLNEAARQMGAGNLRVPLPKLGSDEIGELGDAVDRMRSSLAARDESTQMILAGIAHEIRNPLSGMELFVGLLQDDLRDQPQPLESASRVRRELDYLKRVVEEFLAYAREGALHEHRFAAQPFLHEIAESVRAATGGAVRIEVIEAASGLELSGDREALRGAIHNLAQNAAQACASEGRVEVLAESSGGVRRVVVRDNGCGMADSVILRSTQPFFTTREKGTGLGLPLARKVFERHGGTLLIVSRPGEGTTVTAAWPFRADLPGEEQSVGLERARPREAAEPDLGEMIG